MYNVTRAGAGQYASIIKFERRPWSDVYILLIPGLELTYFGLFLMKNQEYIGVF